MDPVKIRHHIDSLKRKHELLDEEIKQGFTNYKSDFDIEKKKKEKLQLKDEIEKLTRMISI